VSKHGDALPLAAVLSAFLLGGPALFAADDGKDALAERAGFRTLLEGPAKKRKTHDVDRKAADAPLAFLDRTPAARGEVCDGFAPGRRVQKCAARTITDCALRVLGCDREGAF
jgi:hypothetical protein